MYLVLEEGGYLLRPMNLNLRPRESAFLTSSPVTVLIRRGFEIFMSDGEGPGEGIRGAPKAKAEGTRRNGLLRLAGLNGPSWCMAGDGARGMVMAPIGQL